VVRTELGPVDSDALEQYIVSDTFLQEITMKQNGIWGGIYGMGFLGASIYFVEHAASFWMGVFGILKAFFWPALLMYKLLEFIKP
jgi:hypothetical protein